MGGDRGIGLDDASARPPDGAADRSRLLALVGLGVAVVCALLLATSHGVRIARLPQRDISRPSQTLRTSTTSAPPATLPTADGRSGGGASVVALILGIVLAVILLAAATVAAVTAFRWVSEWLGRLRATADTQDEPGGLEPVRSRLHADREQHVDALRAGPPADAVVACWVALERSVADAGVNRAPAETSAELALRVLDALDVDPVAVSSLAALYREARFSTHPLTERDRAQARSDLDAVHDSLAAAAR